MLSLSNRALFAQVVFDFHFEEVAANANTGFDDPTEGAARREALIDVANNVIGQQLNHRATVRVNVTLSEDLPDNTLAQAGQTFFIVPRTFQTGLVAEAIQQGGPHGGCDTKLVLWRTTH